MSNSEKVVSSFQSIDSNSREEGKWKRSFFDDFDFEFNDVFNRHLGIFSIFSDPYNIHGQYSRHPRLEDKYQKRYENSQNELISRDMNKSSRVVPISGVETKVIPYMPSDFIEKDDEYICEISIPKEMIEHISVIEKDNRVMIKGKSEVNIDDSKDGYVHKSRSVKTFQRYLSLPSNAVKDSTIATYSGGKLTLKVQKHKE